MSYCNHQWVVRDELFEAGWIGIEVKCTICASEVWASCDEPNAQLCGLGECENYVYLKAQQCKYCGEELSDRCRECHECAEVTA